MKKQMIVAALAVVLAAAGCTKDENATPPVLTPAVETVEAEAAGGVYEVAYQIENPVDGAQIQPTSNAGDWITNYDITTDGVLKFEVLPNLTDGEVTEARSAVVTVVYSYASGASSFSVNVEQGGSNQTPQLTLVSEQEMDVLSNAAEHTIYFELADEVEDGQLRVYSNDDWITFLAEPAEDSVNFVTAVNTADVVREGTVFVEYAWPDGKRVAEVQVTQASGRITFDARMLMGYYYGLNGNDEVNYQYYFYFTDNGFDELGYAYPNSTYFQVDLRLGERPDNLYELSIPEGEYDFLARADEFPAGVFTTTNGYIVNGDPYVEDMMAYESGHLSVTRNGSQHEMTLEVTLTDGRVATATFSGEVSLINSSGELPMFSGDVTLNPTECVSKLYTAPNGGERNAGGYTVWFYLYDSKTGPMGGSGDVMSVYTFLDADEYWDLMIPGDGVMSVTDDMTVGPGNVIAGYSASYAGTFVTGSYVTRYDEQGRAYYSYVADGELRMSRDADGIFTLEMNFTNQDGDEISGTYTGPIRQDNRPGALSSIKDDFTMDLSPISSGRAVYGGGRMNQDAAGNWLIELVPEYGKAGDGMMIEICTGVASDDISTIEGTYSAAITGAAGTFVAGQWNVVWHQDQRIDVMDGTGYIGDFSADGLACEIAPAIDGEITIIRNDNGTFTIVLSDLVDDHEPAFTFGGTWTGSLTAETYSGGDEAGHIVHAPALNIPGQDGTVVPVVAASPVEEGGSVNWRF